MITFDNNGDILVFSLSFVDAVMEDEVPEWMAAIGEETDHHLALVYCGATTAWEAPESQLDNLFESLRLINNEIADRYGESKASPGGEAFIDAILDPTQDEWEAAKQIEKEPPLVSFRTGIAIAIALRATGYQDMNFTFKLADAAMDQKPYRILDSQSYAAYEKAMTEAQRVLN